VLSAIFRQDPTPTPPILRELEEGIPDDVPPAQPLEGGDLSLLSSF
jgi:hypothetical protein